MTRRPTTRFAALALATAVAVPVTAPPAAAQATRQPDERPGRRDALAASSATPKAPKPPAKFYETETPLAVTLTANLRQLRRDRGGEVPWRAATLTYAGADGAPVVLPLKVRTRGIWRRKHCEFPPLRLNLAEKTTKPTVFDRVDKPKLVNYCRDNEAGEQYILQELQLYRVYALLTPKGHRARLVRAAYVDSASQKEQTTRYAFLLEEPGAMAERLGGAMIEAKGAKAADLDPFHTALFGMFEYFIANTDWSLSQLHNVELLRDSSYSIVPVPYDFDYAGAVNASYATPDPQLPIKRVRDRLYRGHCVPPEQTAAVVALFNAKKDAIYALYRDEIGRLLKPRVVEETLAYYDEFYQTINNPRLAKRAILDACGDGH